eukprot:scaffold6348_cov259-Pinguiococcus_pyrenoidosus.AAC.9
MGVPWHAYSLADRGSYAVAKTRPAVEDRTMMSTYLFLSSTRRRVTFTMVWARMGNSQQQLRRTQPQSAATSVQTTGEEFSIGGMNWNSCLPFQTGCRPPSRSILPTAFQTCATLSAAEASAISFSLLVASSSFMCAT